MDLDKTTGVRYVMCWDFTTCEDASLSISSTPGNSSQNSGSSQSFSSALTGQPSGNKNSQTGPEQQKAPSLQDVDSSVLSFGPLMKQETTPLQDLDPCILRCKPLKAPSTDQRYVQASESFSILGFLLLNGKANSSNEGLDRNEKQASQSPLSIMGEIFSKGQVLASAKSERAIESPGYLYSGGQLIPLALIEDVAARKGFQQKACALAVGITPAVPSDSAPSTLQTTGSPDSVQAGKSTRATSTELSPEFKLVLRDLPEVPVAAGRPSKTFNALCLVVQESKVDETAFFLPRFLDIDVSFRQHKNWCDSENRSASEDSVPMLLSPVAALTSTSGLTSPDQMVLRMTVSQILAERLMLAEQVKSLPSFDIDTSDLPRDCCALDVLSCGPSAQSGGTRDHLDLANVAEEKQSLKHTPPPELSAAVSETADGVEIAFDEASGQLHLVPVYNDASKAEGFDGLQAGDSLSTPEQSRMVDPATQLENMDLDVIFGQKATDLDDECDHPRVSNGSRSANTDPVFQTSASSDDSYLPGALKLGPVGLVHPGLFQTIKVNGADIPIENTKVADSDGEAETYPASTFSENESAPLKRTRDIPLMIINEIKTKFSEIWNYKTSKGTPDIDEAEIKAMAVDLVAENYGSIPDDIIDMMDKLNKIVGYLWQDDFPDRVWIRGFTEDHVLALAVANLRWNYLKSELGQSLLQKRRQLDKSPNPAAVLDELMGLEHKPNSVGPVEEKAILDRRLIRAIHHYNILDTPVHHPCATPSTLSFWAVLASNHKVQINDGASWKAVVSAEAAKLVDPCIFQSETAIPRELYEKGNATKLRNYLTGLTTICYEPWGTWLSDSYEPDEEAPEATNSWAREVLKQDAWSSWDHQGLQRPHFVPMHDLDVKGGVAYGGPYSCSSVNWDKMVRGLGTSDSSKLRYVINAEAVCEPFADHNANVREGPILSNAGLDEKDGASEAETVMDADTESRVKSSNEHEPTNNTGTYNESDNASGDQYFMLGDGVRLQPRNPQDLVGTQTGHTTTPAPSADVEDTRGTVADVDAAADTGNVPDVVPAALVVPDSLPTEQSEEVFLSQYSDGLGAFEEICQDADAVSDSVLDHDHTGADDVDVTSEKSRVAYLAQCAEAGDAFEQTDYKDDSGEDSEEIDSQVSGDKDDAETESDFESPNYLSTQYLRQPCRMVDTHRPRK